MTVLDFVTNCTNLEDFYCYADHSIFFTYRKYHKYKGQWKPNKKVEEIYFSRMNLCNLSEWKKYASFDSFANREIKYIDGDRIYCDFPVEDLLKEWFKLTPNSEIISIRYIKNLISDEATQLKFQSKNFTY